MNFFPLEQGNEFCLVVRVNNFLVVQINELIICSTSQLLYSVVRVNEIIFVRTKQQNTFIDSNYLKQFR